MQKLDFTHTKHYAQAHSETQSRFLLTGGEASLNKSKHNVEANCEGQPPIEFDILKNLIKLETASVSGVLIPAFGLLKTVKSFSY